MLVIPTQTSSYTDPRFFCKRVCPLTREVSSTHVIYSNFSLPQTHPKYPRAALLHAICAVASVYTPAVSNPHLYGTQGNTRSRPLSSASGSLTIGFLLDETFAIKRKGDSPSTFAEEQAKYAAEQIDLLTNLGESLLESLQGVKRFGLYSCTAL